MRISARVIAPIVVLGIAAALTALMASSRPNVESQRPPAALPLVQVVRAEPVEAALEVEAQGTVEPRTESDLVTEVAGRIVEVSPQLASGGFFSTGDVLARIDPRDYDIELEGARAALARAESNLENATSDLARQRSMRQGGASSRALLDDAVHARASAEAGLREARVAVRRAELDMERTEIRAPFDGRVRDKHGDVGQFVGRGVPIARVYATDYAEVRLPITDRDLAFLDLPLRPGADAALPEGRGGPRVRLSADYAGRRLTWKGRVVRTEGALDPRTRMIHVVVRVDDPYGREGEGAAVNGSRSAVLPIGLFVDARIEGRVVRGVFELPRAALRGRGEVLIVDAEDRLRVRRVEVLRAERDRVWVRSGLESGERVVTSAIEVATEGMKVRAALVDVPPQALLRHPALPRPASGGSISRRSS